MATDTAIQRKHGPGSGYPERASKVYLRDDGGFLFLPFAENNEGALSGVDRPEYLRAGEGSAVALGEKTLVCLAASTVSMGQSQGQTPAFLLASGAKTYRAFVKTHQCVDVKVPEGGGSLRVQLWPRNANMRFVGPPCERPDLTIILPEDATPEAIGAAIISVLTAGGIPIPVDGGGSPDRSVGGDDRVGYVDFTTALTSDYRLAVPGYADRVEPVTVLFEAVAPTIGDDPVLFHAAIITLAILCLSQGFLPDYLDEPLRGLADISARLSGADLTAYQGDRTRVTGLLAGGYEVVDTPYPPDYFPGTWDPSSVPAQTWWDDLLAGIPPG